MPGQPPSRPGGRIVLARALPALHVAPTVSQAEKSAQDHLPRTMQASPSPSIHEALLEVVSVQAGGLEETGLRT